MATLTETLALRAIVVVPQDVNPSSEPTCKLLRELGHEVAAVHSPREIAEMLDSTPADLVVVDLPPETRREVLDRLSTLAPDRRPREVAVFSETGEPDREQTTQRVRVFVRPLHVHGLLNVVKRLEESR